MRPGTSLMDVVYRVNDPDDATVKTRALAFVDGVRSFANVLKPVTFVEGTDANLGDAIATGVDHTLTWDVASDWTIDLGQVKFEVLAMDSDELLPFDWITLPAAAGEPEMTISENAPTDWEVLEAYFWQYASGDPGLAVASGIVTGTAASGMFEGIALVDGSDVHSYGVPYILKQMDLGAGGRDATNYAVAARSSILEPTSWHALSQPWADIDFVAGWGQDNYGKATPPQGLSDVAAIAAGSNHSLALLGDGTVTGWGRPSSGLPQYDTYYEIAIPPAGLANVTAIAAGGDFSLALLGDGTVVGWGRDTDDQATPPVGLSGVTAIAAGDYHSLALLSNGTVVGWGQDNSGQATPPAGLTNVTAIAAGNNHSLALLDDGTVVGWGNVGTIPEGLTNVTAISVRGSQRLALLDDETVVGWGSSNATPPEGLTGVTAIAAGGGHSLALLNNGTVVGWGYDINGQATPPTGLANVTAIAAGSGHSLALIKAAP
jgi:hypothetical protein